MTDLSGALLALLVQAAQNQTLTKLIFSKPHAGQPEKQTARLSQRRGQPVLAFEQTLSGGKVAQVSLALPVPEEALAPLVEGYDRVHLYTTVGSAEFLRSKKGKETLLGGAALARAMAAGALPRAEVRPLDRAVNRLLSGEEPFLLALGISDATGRVHDKRQAKFRQINRFLEHVRDIEDALPAEGPLLVYDLCCGKSYLSFALYHYLTHLCGRQVDMLCVDLKADVIAYCGEVARAVGFEGMRFLVADVADIPADRQPDLVVSLHACDTATDLVLDRAAALGARVILSTPCCHHDLNGKLRTPDLSFIIDEPHLRNKLAEAATDGLRLLRLRSRGYRAVAVEFIDPDDTPKNTLLRAVKRKGFDPVSTEAQALRQAYETTLRYLTGSSGDGEDGGRLP
ncbi:MAG: SAM-dependent methyltransferase [Eubacteriales bacterium]